MNEEQIRQNAEEYADGFYDRKFQNSLWKDKYYAHIAGAHSRDEEIENLRNVLQSEQEQSHAYIVELKNEITQLRNP